MGILNRNNHTQTSEEEALVSALSGLSNTKIKPRNKVFQKNLEKSLANLHASQLAAREATYAKIAQPKVQTKNDNASAERGFMYNFFKLQTSFALSFVVLLFCSTGVLAAYVGSPSVQSNVANLLQTKQYGKLAVQSSPAGAEVFIGGIKIGTTPLITDYPVGDYTLQLKLADHDDYTKEVVLVANQREDLNLAMIETNPDIYADYSEYSLADYGVSLKRPNNARSQIDIADVSAGPIVSIDTGEAVIKVTLEDNVASIPEGYQKLAKIWINPANLNGTDGAPIDQQFLDLYGNSSNEADLAGEADLPEITVENKAERVELAELIAKSNATRFLVSGQINFRYMVSDKSYRALSLTAEGDHRSIFEAIYSLASINYDSRKDKFTLHSELTTSDLERLGPEILLDSKLVWQDESKSYSVVSDKLGRWFALVDGELASQVRAFSAAALNLGLQPQLDFISASAPSAENKDMQVLYKLYWDGKTEADKTLEFTGLELYKLDDDTNSSVHQISDPKINIKQVLWNVAGHPLVLVGDKLKLVVFSNLQLQDRESAGIITGKQYKADPKLADLDFSGIYFKTSTTGEIRFAPILRQGGAAVSKLNFRLNSDLGKLEILD